MTTKDTIIQQLNDKLAAAIEQEKAEIATTLFVVQPEQTEDENDNTETE